MQKKLTGTLLAFALTCAPLAASAQQQFSWPTESRTISAPYISLRAAEQPYLAHSGIDIAAWTGTPIHAAAAGIVTKASCSKKDHNTPIGLGCIVVIQHGWKWKTVYEHLDSIAVTTNQSVDADQTIGTVGNTGMSTGPHLHFEIQKRTTKQSYNTVDPLKHLQ